MIYVYVNDGKTIPKSKGYVNYHYDKDRKKKTKWNRNKQKALKKKKKIIPSNVFYSSREWRELRVKALTKYGRHCCLCGRGVEHGIILHVDHIKPRSKNPYLGLDINNLQILCEDCNIGKSNKYSEDWRNKPYSRARDLYRD